MSIFILMVAVGLYYASVITAPSTPFAEQVRDTSSATTTSFQRLASWTVNIVPVTVSAPAASSTYPIEIPYTVPPEYNPATLAARKGQTSQQIQFDRADNTTTILTSLEEGENHFEISYATSSDLDPLPEPDRINRSGSTLETTDWTADLDTDGIDDLTYDGETYLTDSTLTGIGTGQDWTNGTIRYTRHYENATVRGFGGTGQIRITQDNADDSTVSYFDLDAAFSSLETEDSTTDVTGPGTHYSGTTDYATFTYDSGGTTYGLTLVGTEMDLTVGRQSAGSDLETNLTTPGQQRSLMLLAHTGDSSATSAQRDIFLDGSQTIGLVQHRRGIAEHELETLDDMGTDTLATELGLTEMGFNITVDGYGFGDPIPSGQDVAALEYPLPNLQRWGNSTRVTFNLAVWL
ncbi:MAG: hypothetical protein MUP66_01990 [Candidatus Nanohaloarchaeota archaeon QJJ-5]|nr:hypothetical protein [Candidatus Nanohaloarchaeota archaeon QJJ-5]